MGIGQQQPIRDTVDEVCTDVSRIIYAIFSENRNDNTLELLRLKLDVQKTVGNLNKFVKVLRRHIAGVLVDMFIEQLVEKYTTEEQRKAFIKEVCEIVLDSLPTFNIEERLYRILNKKYDTEEYRNTFLRLAAEQGNLRACLEKE
ncbi:insulinase family protein [Wolbachia endosymbiont of Psylliodes chrysocephala]|uniref:insulinase family protein n=1 Tax=Wolbachia endosymbiont of Psylliodes chrysocephala TaxID=2883236 RepID=UPI00209DA2A7|nr:insulinase family protein [Wolbachia endosymbiont of Psylliodes chrysocephala]